MDSRREDKQIPGGDPAILEVGGETKPSPEVGPEGDQ